MEVTQRYVYARDLNGKRITELKPYKPNLANGKLDRDEIYVPFKPRGKVYDKK